MLINKAVILAKIETTYGTDSTPTGAANAILCGDLSFEPLDSKLERNNVKPNYGAKRFVSIGEGQKISFSAEVKGSGAAGTAPEVDPLLRSCNMTKTTVAGTSNLYTPNSAQSTGESSVIYYYLDGVLHKIVGSRGTVSLTAETNKYAIQKYEFTGLYAGPVAASLVTPTFNATLPPIFRSAAFTLDSYAAVIEKFNIDLKNEIAKRTSANAATGILEYYIKDRAVSGTIDPEMVLPATKDFWGMWNSGAAFAMACTIGSTAGNRCVITAPAVQLDKPKYASRENILTLDMPLILAPTDAGNDEVTFLYN